MKYKRVKNDRGLVLPLTLLVVVILSAAAFAILSIGALESQIASNHLRSIQADFLAEAGLEHAFNWLQPDPANRMTNPTTLSNSQLGGVGSYFVQYQAAGADTVRVVSTGTTAIGGSQKIRRATMSTSFHSNDAILTDDALTISGSTDVLTTGGQCGNVHTNGNLVVNGGTNLHIVGDATASGTYQEIGSPRIDGEHDPELEPEKTIPNIDPAYFLTVAQASLPADHLFQMKADGKVLDGSGNLIETLASGDTSACGWRYTSGTPLAEWQFSGAGTPCNGTYYFEGHATVSSSPGSTANPWKTTLLAAGNLNLAGKPVIGDDAAYTVHDTLFVAGLDIEINGTPSNGYNGMIAAHEHFSLSGNGSINGFIIGENASNASSLVTANSVSGNITLTYNCGSNPPLRGPLQILSWGL